MFRSSPLLLASLLACGGGSEPSVTTTPLDITADRDTSTGDSGEIATEGPWETPDVPGNCTNVVTVDEDNYYGDGYDGVPDRIRVEFYDPHPNLTRSQWHISEDYDSLITTDVIATPGSRAVCGSRSGIDRTTSMPSETFPKTE